MASDVDFWPPLICPLMSVRTRSATHTQHTRVCTHRLRYLKHCKSQVCDSCLEHSTSETMCVCCCLTCIYLFCVSDWGLVGADHVVNMEVRGQSWFSFYCVGSKDEIQVISLAASTFTHPAILPAPENHQFVFRTPCASGSFSA